MTDKDRVRYTPTWYDERVSRAWDEHVRSGYEGDWEQPERNGDELANRNINDAERIAIDLLRESEPKHPLIDVWIHRLCDDSTCVDEFPTWESVTLDTWRTWAQNTDQWFASSDARLQGVIDEWVTQGYGTKRKAGLTIPTYPADAEPQLIVYRDESIMRLAWALIEHRLTGEDGHSPLTKAIPAYHEAIQHVLYVQLERQKRQ